MRSRRAGGADVDRFYVSTGHLPPAPSVSGARVRVASALQDEQRRQELGRLSCARGRPGRSVRRLRRRHQRHDLCKAATRDHPFSIMSVSKPFVFALVCQADGADAARRRLGVNATGLPFNSLAAMEQSADGRTNPMVNSGAIATTSLVPGATRRHGGPSSSTGCRGLQAELWRSTRRCSRRPRMSNARNQAIGQLLRSLRPDRHRSGRGGRSLYQAMLVSRSPRGISP